MLFLISCTDSSDGQADTQSLARSNETVIYEVSIEINPESPNWMGNIDNRKLITELFSQVENGELAAYSALRGAKGGTISWEDILYSLDAVNDTVQVMSVETGEMETLIIEGQLSLNEIKGLIFIEEWSLMGNAQIVKEVLGVAPVRYIYSVLDTIGQKPTKSIPFVAYYGHNKPELFESY